MLSLIELQSKKVEAKRKKYDADEMDVYLELVFDNYKSLLEENRKLEAEKAELNKKIKTLSDGVQYYRSIETTLQKALVLAEKTSKETTDAAAVKATEIEKEAHKKADQIVKIAEEEYAQIKNKSARLVQQFNQYKMQLKQAASAQLQLVEGTTFNISKPDVPETPIEVSKPHDISANLVSEPENVEKTVAAAPVKEAAAPAAEEKPVVSHSEKPKSSVVSSLELGSMEPSSIESASTEEILNADTIDLRATLDTVNQLENTAADTANINAPKTADVDAVSNVTLVEPIKAKTIEPLDITFEGQMAEKSEKKPDMNDSLQEAEKKKENVPTLDSLLQDLNINNSKNKKSDDPFEFLGSVDDF